MKDLLKKILYTGLGAAVVTKEKAEELVTTLIHEGEISEEEGRTIIKDFQERARVEQEKIVTRIKEELERKYENVGLVTKKELEHLRLEIRDLNVRLKELEEKWKGGEQGD